MALTTSLRLSLITALALAAIGATGCSAEATDDTAGGGQAQTGENVTPIDAVSTLSIDGEGKLAFGYSMGGGCAEHTPTAKIQLATGKLEGAIEITDVASGPDLCEALLYPQGEASIGALLSEAGKDKDISGRRVTLSLPHVAIQAGAGSNMPAPTPAAVRHEVRDISNLSIDRDGQLELSYRTGGGCAEHTAAISVELEEAPNGGGTIAKVKVFDETPTEDFCEAYIGVDGTADLPTLIGDAAKAAGKDLSNRRVVVELPSLAFTAE